MIINPDIAKRLKESKIPYEEGLCYLLTLYYDCTPNYIPELIMLQVLAVSGIVVRNMDKSLTWKIPLFEHQETNFAWVTQYRDTFRNINSDRAGTLSTCVIRMKKFFSENPAVRLEDVKGAVKMYIRTVKDPQYLITSHKFIYEGNGSSRNSPLEEWIEKYKEAEGLERKSESKVMQ